MIHMHTSLKVCTNIHKVVLKTDNSIISVLLRMHKVVLKTDRQTFIYGRIHCFLGARAPLELANVKKNNNNKKIRKKFLIAITCSLLLVLAP